MTAATMTEAATRLDALTAADAVENLRRLEASACAARDLMIAHAAVARAAVERIRRLAEEARASKAQADADLAEAARIAADLAADLSRPRQATPTPEDVADVRVAIDAIDGREGWTVLAAALATEKQAEAERQAEEEAAPPATTPSPNGTARKGRGRR